MCLIYPAILLLGSCATLTAPSQSVERPAVLDSIRIAGDIETHLDYLNGSEAEGRATGTRGMIRAATYASERFREARLQPLVENEFGLLFPTGVHRVLDVSLIRYGPDTLIFKPGSEIYSADGSDGGSARFHSIRFSAVHETSSPAEVVVIPADAFTGKTVPIAEDAGVLLIVGPLRVLPADSVFSGRLVVQITPAALETLVGGWPEDRTGNIEINATAEIRVTAAHTSSGSGINVLGLIPGSHPVLQNELVVVSASLDGYGQLIEAGLTDGADLGESAAALIELALFVSNMQSRTHSLDRSILFVLFDGSRHSRAGLKAFLRYPPWPIDAIRSFVDLNAGTDTDSPGSAIFDSTAVPIPVLRATDRMIVSPDERTPYNLRGVVFHGERRKQAIRTAEAIFRNAARIILNEASEGDSAIKSDGAIMKRRVGGSDIRESK